MTERDILKLVYAQVRSTEKGCKKAETSEEQLQLCGSALDGIKHTLKSALEQPQCQFVFNNFRCGLRKGHKDGHVCADVVHATALSAIQQLMDGKHWSPDTLDDIAQILQQAGFEVRDARG